MKRTLLCKNESVAGSSSLGPLVGVHYPAPVLAQAPRHQCLHRPKMDCYFDFPAERKGAADCNCAK